jgi:hypothetical protein
LILQALVGGAGIAHSTRETLEDGFNFVVIGAAVHDYGVQVCSGVVSKASKEIFEQFNLEIAYMHNVDLQIEEQRGTAAQVNGDDGKGFVHGLDEVAGAIDAEAVSQCLREEVTQDDADVFDRMMLVNVEIAMSRKGEIEGAVLGEKLQHMVEEADASRDLVTARAINVERSRDLRFLGIPLDNCFSHDD